MNEPVLPPGEDDLVWQDIKDLTIPAGFSNGFVVLEIPEERQNCSDPSSICVNQRESKEALATIAVRLIRSCSYSLRAVGNVSFEGNRSNRPPRIAASSMPMAAPCARYGVMACAASPTRQSFWDGWTQLGSSSWVKSCYIVRLKVERD